MIPVGLLYFLVIDMMNGGASKKHVAFYAVGALVCLCLIFIATWFQYNATYLATYVESGVRRISLAEQIRKIEEEIAALPTDSSEEQTSDASGTAFPQFEGKDLDGNKVDSSVFAENAVTVVNFWFNECKPCVEELSEMNALNDRIKEQGGEVLGVNVGALDGDEQNIATAKQILETKGAKYRNIYFDSDSDAGKFALGVTAFPTTYVIDRNGNIVGEALMGGIDNDDNLNTLQNTIDEVIAMDAQK